VKKERRQKLSSAEWRQITSRRPMVCRIPPPPTHSHTTSQSSDTFRGPSRTADWGLQPKSGASKRRDGEGGQWS
jgi:hypothetical protein